MKGSIKGRLAKLESSTGTGKREFIYVHNLPGETREEFDRRVEALVREATERDGCEPLVMKVLVAHPEPKEDGRSELASRAVVDAEGQLGALSGGGSAIEKGESREQHQLQSFEIRTGPCTLDRAATSYWSDNIA